MNNNQSSITNNQTIINKQFSSDGRYKSKGFDLEDRTYNFAKRCRNYVHNLPKTLSNIEYGRQLIRSSGSTASNYIEANESLGKRDFIMRIKIVRKEAKESRLWVRLTEPNLDTSSEQKYLIQEATELIKIFSSIIERKK